MENIGDNRPLYPEDILGSEPTSDAIQADIDESVSAMADGDLQQRNTMYVLKELESYTRDISFGLLDRLIITGIDEAETVSESLAAINPEEHPLQSSLSNVASAYADQAKATDDEAEHDSLESLSGLAHATFCIAVAKAVVELAPEPLRPLRGLELILVARSVIETEEGNLSDDTISALLTLLDELQSQLPPPSPEL